MGENELRHPPVAMYGVVLLPAAAAYFVLTRALWRDTARTRCWPRRSGATAEGMFSLLLYLVGVALAFVLPAAACGVYVLVAVIWLVPDRRIEKHLAG
ncbi:MAG: hypothetical protein IPJ24_10755 [bacterium]|nr:hypothetical protein [bacterium]